VNTVVVVVVVVVVVLVVLVVSDGHSVNLSRCPALLWGHNEILIFLLVRQLLSSSTDERTGLQFAVLSLTCPSLAGPITIYY
jgi:hypothetical protein